MQCLSFISRVILGIVCLFHHVIQSEQKIAEEDRRVRKIQIRMKTSIQTVDTSL